jgi:hypothetical protein
MARRMFPRLGGKYLRSEASCQAGASSAIEEIAPPTSSCFGCDWPGERKNEIPAYTKRKFQLSGVQ